MTFISWLEKCGGRVHKDLDLFHSLSTGDRGVVACRDIAEGDLLLLLPITCALYIPNEEEYAKNPDAFPSAVRQLRESHPGLSPFLSATLVLLSEMTRGSASTWGPYLATLPPSCPDCLLHWNAEDKAELEGTSLEEAAASDPAADVYRRHVAAILASRPDLWPGLGGPGGDTNTTGGSEAEEEGLKWFLRAAGLVQSRAFHLEAENWVSGAKEISKLDDGGTQVFMLPGIDMINHSHNPAARNAHLERLNVAQATVTLGGPLPPPAEGATAAEAYFVMRADKPIKAGEQILHTYGNLSDAQLLQTYGFLDSDDIVARQPDAACTAGSPAGAATKKRAKRGTATADGEGEGGVRNPYNAALVPWSVVEEVCSGLLRSMDQAPPASLLRAKRDFLAAAGDLQAAAPDSTQFVLLAKEPLPDELTTAVQVLLMTKDEFQELKREFGGGSGDGSAAAPSAKGGKGKRGDKQSARAGGSKKGAAAAKSSNCGSATTGTAGASGGGAGLLPKLSLGTALLEEDEDFAEMVCITTLQVLEACVERYPTSANEDVRLLRKSECTGRQRLAVRVRLGEKDVLQLAKKAVVELLRRLREGSAGASKEEEEDEEEEEEPVQGGDGGRQPSAKKRRQGLGAPESEEGAAEGDSGSESEDDDEENAGDLLMGSDDSDKVGYGAEEYDDGIGEAHDRGKAHEAPKEDN